MLNVLFAFKSNLVTLGKIFNTDENYHVKMSMLECAGKFTSI